MVLVVGWPIVLLTGLAMMMALHVARMEAPNDEEWFIFGCLVVKVKGYYVDNLCAILRAIDVCRLTTVYLCFVMHVDMCNTRQ